MAYPRYNVYVIEHVSSGKSYVGVSGNADARRVNHFGSPSVKTAIGRAMRSLGSMSFTWRLVDHSENKRDAGLRERFWVHLLEANDPRFGYNSPKVYRVK